MISSSPSRGSTPSKAQSVAILRQNRRGIWRSRNGRRAVHRRLSHAAVRLRLAVATVAAATAAVFIVVAAVIVVWSVAVVAIVVAIVVVIVVVVAVVAAVLTAALFVLALEFSARWLREPKAMLNHGRLRSSSSFSLICEDLESECFCTVEVLGAKRCQELLERRDGH